MSCSSLPFIDFSRWRHRTSNGGGWIWNRGAKGKDKDKGKGKKPWFRNPETRSNWHLCYINDYMYCITGYFMRERILSMGVEFCIMFYFYLKLSFFMLVWLIPWWITFNVSAWKFYKQDKCYCSSSSHFYFFYSCYLKYICKSNQLIFSIKYWFSNGFLGFLFCLLQRK